MEIFHNGEPIDARECTLYLYALLLAHLLTTFKKILRLRTGDDKKIFLRSFQNF